MNCLFDKCELINGIVLGLLSSFLASWITFRFIKLRQKQIDKSKYKPLEGFYKGKTMTDPTKPIEISNFTSQAKIEYILDNHLKIQLTDFPDSGHNNWVGEITMESEMVGTILWYYEKHKNIDLSSNRHLFGLKKIIVRKIEKDIFIYLIDEYFPDSKHNPLKEVLMKTN